MLWFDYFCLQWCLTYIGQTWKCCVCAVITSNLNRIVCGGCFQLWEMRDEKWEVFKMCHIVQKQTQENPISSLATNTTEMSDALSDVTKGTGTSLSLLSTTSSFNTQTLSEFCSLPTWATRKMGISLTFKSVSSNYIIKNVNVKCLQ